MGTDQTLDALTAAREAQRVQIHGLAVHVPFVKQERDVAMIESLR